MSCSLQENETDTILRIGFSCFTVERNLEHVLSRGAFINQPFIFDIKRGSFDDGPGIRSIVFFKGCPLSCTWCHNPESIKPYVEIAFSPDTCIRCMKCRSVCPVHAIDPESGVPINRKICTHCRKCADICPSAAARKIGEQYTSDALCSLLLKDLDYYYLSGGGISLGGGEPPLFPGFAGRICKQLKRHGIHLLVQTCGYFSYEQFRKKLLPFIDMVYFDLKLIDPAVHMKYTGRSNELIISNFLKLVKEPCIKVIPRIPLVPFITTTEENLTGIARLLESAGCTEYVLLPFNSGGVSKAAAIGAAFRYSIPEPEIVIAEERKSTDLFERLMHR